MNDGRRTDYGTNVPTRTTGLAKARSRSEPILAIDGGPPVRETLLPYGRHWLDESDVQAVVEALRSDWLTTGPLVDDFESAFAEICGVSDAVAVSSGTAALHAAMNAIGVSSGDEVIVPAMTFVSTANAAVFVGATPVFADVDPTTLLIDPVDVQEKISDRTRAVVAVDYAGQPCDYGALRDLADQHDFTLVADACHSIGGEYRGRPVGSLADISAFSLHAVKHVTTGEGGVVTTGRPELASRVREFRNHGISSDHRQRAEAGSWFYEMVELGFNYRITDFQCALGVSQLRKLPAWVARRKEIARRYDERIAELPGVEALLVRPDVSHAYHLYVIQVDRETLGVDREWMYSALRAEGIGVNVHYIPVHLHPFYRTRFGTTPGMCPVAEDVYERILSLPVFPQMTDENVSEVLAALDKIAYAYPYR